MARSFLLRVYESQPVQVFLALLIYTVYAGVLGVCLIPTVALVWWGVATGSVVLAAFATAGGLFAYFLWGSVFMAALIRLLSWGIGPGRYPKVSLTTLRWLIYSGIHTMAVRSILPYIPVSYFSNLYFGLCGAKIGKNVYINTNTVSDPYLLTLADGVIVGGAAEVTCHIMEREFLILDEVRIGRDSLIGTGAYVSPGVIVGERCTVGARCYLRRGTVVPDGSVYTVVAGLPLKQVAALEKGRLR